jgi:hypothetical protein
MLEFLKKFTVYPIEDNPKMAAFYAFILGAITDRFGWSAAQFLLGFLS